MKNQWFPGRIGAVTSTPPQAGPPAGWYSDPADQGRERYWDGRGWTQVVRQAGANPGSGGRQTVFQPAPPPRSDPARDQPLAGWWLKFFSGVIDYIVVTALTILVLLVFARGFAVHFWQSYWEYAQEVSQSLTPGGPLPSIPQGLISAAATISLLGGGVMAVYTIIFLGSWGATLGQRLVGIWVIKAPLPASMLSPEAKAAFRVERCGWLRAISKGLSWSLFSTGGQWFLLIQLVNVLLPLWHKRRQSLTDLFANTLVIVGKPHSADPPDR